MNGEEIVKNIEDTPFRTIKSEGRIYLAMYNEIIENWKEEEEEELLQYVKSKPWRIMLIAGAIFTNEINKQRK